MASPTQIRLKKMLLEAEGYFDLKLPQHALARLKGLDDLKDQTSAGSYMRGLYMRGEALRQMERYQEALMPLVEASEISPDTIPIWLALGWCYKRIGRIDQAIMSLQRAREVDASDSLIIYNLACYWSLARERGLALKHLAQALQMNPGFRQGIDSESDFDFLRSDPEFRALTEIVA